MRSGGRRTHQRALVNIGTRIPARKPRRAHAHALAPENGALLRGIRARISPPKQRAGRQAVVRPNDVMAHGTWMDILWESNVNNLEVSPARLTTPQRRAQAARVRGWAGARGM